MLQAWHTAFVRGVAGMAANCPDGHAVMGLHWALTEPAQPPLRYCCEAQVLQGEHTRSAVAEQAALSYFPVLQLVLVHAMHVDDSPDVTVKVPVGHDATHWPALVRLKPVWQAVQEVLEQVRQF